MSVVMAIGTSAQYADDYSDFYGSGAAAALGLTTMVCLLIFVGIPLIIAILLAIWIYKDAEERGKSGALWAVLLIIVSILIPFFIGLILVSVIWLAIRPPIGGKKEASSERRCPNCGRIIPDDARVCPYCSKKFEE